MKKTSGIALLFALYCISPADFLILCNLLNACDFSALYFKRNGKVYRVFLPVSDIPDTWYRPSMSSKNNDDIRFKLYIPADDMDCLIENGAECLGNEDAFFANFSPIDENGKTVNRGHYVEEKEITAVIHNAVNVADCNRKSEVYINRPVNKHLSVFEGGDYSIEAYNRNDEEADFYEISVKLQDSTVYSLDSIALYFNKNPEKVARLCRCLETGENILKTVTEYTKKYHAKHAKQ